MVFFTSPYLSVIMKDCNWSIVTVNTAPGHTSSLILLLVTRLIMGNVSSEIFLQLSCV